MAGLDTIDGVLAPYPVGGGGVPGEAYRLSIRLLAYRIGGGPVARRPMTISQRIRSEEMDDWFARLRGQATVAATGHHRAGIDQFEMRDYLGASSDAEIVALADTLARPVSVEDPVFGQLTLERGFRSFSGRGRFDGAEVSLSVRAKGEAPDPAVLSMAHAFFGDAAAWNQRLRDYAASELLELKNDNWSNDGQAPMETARFVATLKPESVSIGDDGHFSVDYSAGTLFLGHNIMVSGTLSGGPDRAHI